MLLTFALVVLGSAFVVLFSQEFGKGFKKLFEIPGMLLCLPIIAASVLVAIYEPWILWVLLKIQTFLMSCSNQLTAMLPAHSWAPWVAKGIILLLLALLPMSMIGLWNHFKRYRTITRPYLLGSILWTVAAVLMTVQS